MQFVHIFSVAPILYPFNAAQFEQEMNIPPKLAEYQLRSLSSREA